MYWINFHLPLYGRGCSSSEFLSPGTLCFASFELKASYKSLMGQNTPLSYRADLAVLSSNLRKLPVQKDED